jgi:hypothetical protein
MHPPSGAPLAKLVAESGVRERPVQMSHKEGKITAGRGVYNPLAGWEDRQPKLFWFVVPPLALGEHQLALADMLLPRTEERGQAHFRDKSFKNRPRRGLR